MARPEPSQSASQVAIKLNGGPAPLDGWSNVYAADPLGGWPLPDEVAAFAVPAGIGVAVAVARVEQAEEHLEPDQWVRYRKVRQSKLPDGHDDLFVRGAEYEACNA